jgi:hypothetical protein
MAAQAERAASTLRPPARLLHGADALEVSVHVAPRALMRELRHLFGDARLPRDARVLCVPTSQRACLQLVNWGETAAVEKDRCLEVFVAFGEALRTALGARGHWCDYIDPCSGLPAHTKECTSVYDEVSGHQCLLRYVVSQAGGCKVLVHPRWGTACYPATIFTTAPDAALLEIVAAFPPAPPEAAPAPAAAAAAPGASSSGGGA